MNEFKSNQAGWRELFTSKQMQDTCLEAAQKVASKANASAASVAHSPCTPYAAMSDVHSNTAIGHVMCHPRFYELEMAHRCLKNSI